MVNLPYLVRKAISYYSHDGAKETVYAILRKILWYPYKCYRMFRWNIIRKKPQEQWLPEKILNMQLFLNPADNGLSAELAIEGIHEPFLTALLNTLIDKEMKVVDIGSNIGYFALLESRLVGPSGKVIAIEPSPITFPLLKQNIELNKAYNIVPVDIAISDRTGKTTMYMYEQANWNSLIPLDRKFASCCEVDTITLDELLKNESKVDVIRMDIEGYECNVIYGMKNVLERHSPLLIVELHSSFTPLDSVITFLNDLRGLRYDIKWIFPRRKEEVFMSKVLTNRKRIYEKLSIGELIDDDRMTKFKENFTVVFERAL